MTIGIIKQDGRAVFGYGRMSQGDPRVPEADTIFEIGSITKAFTGVLLADMAQSKLVELDEPVQKLLPDSVMMPKRGEAEITLLDLTTHASGLPRMPDNWKPATIADPYADYTEELLFEYLNQQARPNLLRALKKVFTDSKAEPKIPYSNLGAGLLGHVLALRAGKESYEELLVERIAQPLAMNDTRISLNAEQLRRVAPGHDNDCFPVDGWNWEHSSLAGAGAIRSSAADMLRFLSANIGLVKTKLTPAMKASHQIRHKVGEHWSNGLGWHVDTKRQLIWHDGQTGGYRSIVVFDTKKKLGVVVLANMVSHSVDSIGFLSMMILQGQELPPIRPRRPAKIDRKILAQCVGTYEVSPAIRFTITLEEDRLLLQRNDDPKVRIYPSWGSGSQAVT